MDRYIEGTYNIDMLEKEYGSDFAVLIIKYALYSGAGSDRWGKLQEILGEDEYIKMEPVFRDTVLSLVPDCGSVCVPTGVVGSVLESPFRALLGRYGIDISLKAPTVSALALYLDVPPIPGAA